MIRLAFNILSLALAVAAAHGLMRGWLSATLAEWPLAVRGLLALVALALGVSGFASTRRLQDPAAATARRRPGWVDHAASAGLLLALLGGFLWLIGSAPPAIERLGLAAEPWLRPDRAAQRSESESQLTEDTRAGNWLWQDRRVRELPRRASLRPGNRPEVFLRFASPQDAAAVIAAPAYLSSFALSKYDGDRWTTPTTTRSAQPAWENSQPPARLAYPAVNYEVFHGVNSAGQNVLTTLQGASYADTPPLEQYDEGFAMLPPPSDDGIGYQYRARSHPLTLKSLPPEMFIEPPATPSPWLTELPENTRVAKHLKEVTRSILGDQPTIHSLIALEQWLQGAFDYSLDTTNPLDLDPLENFLFAERRGHCEHFATTCALMLRTHGLPSRVAYGWAGGTWYEASQLMVMRSREAHAWTEVLLPDLGWVVIDPTPPTSSNGTRARIAPPEEKSPELDMADHDSHLDEDTSRIDVAALWLLGIVGFPTATLLAWRNRRRNGHIIHSLASSGTEPGDFPGYLDAWLAACPPRRPGETLRQQIRAITPVPPFAASLADYHYRSRYQGARRDARRERALARAIRTWAKSRESL